MRSGLNPLILGVAEADERAMDEIELRREFEEVDRILALEREIKRGQISLMVRIKNTLTGAQQAKLAEVRNRKD